MFQIIKLYSDRNKFNEINFKTGINLILGTESKKTETDKVDSRKMNGVGKSLVIELINFCLLKRKDQSRVTSLPDDILSKDEFINLHFKIDNDHYVFSRNKKGDIKIKSGSNGEFIEYEDQDAKDYLKTILHLRSTEISAREYLNFVIKEENYTYANFGELYRTSDYSTMLKIHFFFYGFPLQVLNGIKSTFTEHNEASNLMKKIRNSLSIEKVDLKELEAKRNQYKDAVSQMESNLDYDKMLSNIGNKKKDFLKIENEITDLLTEVSILRIELDEINNFSDIFSEDIYIDDNDLQIIFNKYVQGLGSIIKKDIEELKKFRNQLLKFNNEFLDIKKNELETKIESNNKRIEYLQSTIDSNTKNIIKNNASSVINNFRIYREENEHFQHYSKILEEKDNAESLKKSSKYNFNDYMKNLEEFLNNNQSIIESLNNDFVEIHKEIMGNAECSFGIETENVFKPAQFFKFKVKIQGKGSKGVNQTSAVIYDLVLLKNKTTKDRHIGCIIHDNLIFGTVDSDTSAKVLNHLNKLNKEYQYIATVNIDDFSYCEKYSLFDADYKNNNVIVELSKDKPLFNKTW